jgi:hypothetical protein
MYVIVQKVNQATPPRFASIPDANLWGKLGVKARCNSLIYHLFSEFIVFREIFSEAPARLFLHRHPVRNDPVKSCLMGLPKFQNSPQFHPRS